MCNLYNLKVECWELRAYYQANNDFRREIEIEELAKDYMSKATPGLIVRQVNGQRLLRSTPRPSRSS
jgi:thioredoxin-related protein